MSEREPPHNEAPPTQPKYLLNMGGRPALHLQADNLNTLHYVEQTRVAESGFTVPTGSVDKSQLHVMTSHYGRTFAAAAEEARGVVRELRPQEAEDLTVIDQQIADLLAQVQNLREERKHVVKRAWEKGHVVYLKTLLGIAEEHLRRRQQPK